MAPTCGKPEELHLNHIFLLTLKRKLYIYYNLNIKYMFTLILSESLNNQHLNFKKSNFCIYICEYYKNISSKIQKKVWKANKISRKHNFLLRNTFKVCDWHTEPPLKQTSLLSISISFFKEKENCQTQSKNTNHEDKVVMFRS